MIRSSVLCHGFQILALAHVAAPTPASTGVRGAGSGAHLGGGRLPAAVLGRLGGGPPLAVGLALGGFPLRHVHYGALVWRPLQAAELT